MRSLLADLDLHALTIAGLIFTVLGVSGVADAVTLSSLVLGLLTVLAFSQVRTRREWRGQDRGGVAQLFWAEFPQELYEHRSNAQKQYIYIGMSGYRTISTGLRDFEAILRRGGEVRILLMDHSNGGLLQLAAERSSATGTPARLRDRILSSISELDGLTSLPGLQIRLSPFLPSVGINASDIDHPGGVIFVQHYEFLPSGESGPIYRIQVSDGDWFDHQRAEIERMWAAARPI